MEIYPRRLDPYLPILNMYVSPDVQNEIQNKLDREIKADLEEMSWEYSEIGGYIDKLELAARIVALHEGKSEDLVARGAIELIRISGVIAAHSLSSEAAQLIDQWSQLRLFGNPDIFRHETTIDAEDINVFEALGAFGKNQDKITHHRNSRYWLPVLDENTPIGTYRLKNVVGWLAGR